MFIIRVVQHAAIIFMLFDESMGQLCTSMNASLQHYEKCIAALIYCLSDDQDQNSVDPSLQITITLPPNATEKQIVDAYKKECKNMVSICNKHATNARNHKRSVHDEITERVRSILTYLLNQKHDEGSREFAFMNVLNVARTIKVNEEDDDYLPTEVDLLVQACNALLSL